MEEKHLIDKFLEFEEKNNLFDIKIRGINIWYHIRFDVYSQIISKKNDLGRAHFTKTRVLKFKDYLLNNEIYLYKYFNPEYTRNNTILSRLYSLELLIHKFNLNIG